MKFEIQTIKKYIVENAEVGAALETIKNNGEQIVRILDYVEPVIEEASNQYIHRIKELENELLLLKK